MKTPIAPVLKFAVLASDTALFTIRDGELLVRLIHVNRPPHFPDNSGLPGGLIDPKETAEDAARRHIKAKAHIDADKIYLEQLYTFSALERDKRGRVVAVAYLGLVPWEKLSDEEREGSTETYWVHVSQKPRLKLAYDHDEMVTMALARLRSRVRYTTLMQKFMPEEFTLTELEHCYESILGTDLDKRNFRKKILKLKVLTELPRKRSGGRFRPAQLYRFTSGKIDELELI